MAPSAVSVKMESPRLDLGDSKGVSAERPRPVVHGGLDVTSIQAISHGPVTIGGTSLSVFSSLQHARALWRVHKDHALSKYLYLHLLLLLSNGFGLGYN